MLHIFLSQKSIMHLDITLLHSTRGQKSFYTMYFDDFKQRLSGWFVSSYNLFFFKKKPWLVWTCMRNHNIKSSPFAMNHFLYLLPLFGWKAHTPGSQVGATLLVASSSAPQKDCTWNTAKINQFTKEVEVTVHLPSVSSRLRVVVFKTVFI